MIIYELKLQIMLSFFFAKKEKKQKAREKQRGKKQELLLAWFLLIHLYQTNPTKSNQIIKIKYSIPAPCINRIKHTIAHTITQQAHTSTYTKITHIYGTHIYRHTYHKQKTNTNKATTIIITWHLQTSHIKKIQSFVVVLLLLLFFSIFYFYSFI